MAADIIKKISDDDYVSHHWSPHRPVVKEGNLTTTKIRPVFNCSFHNNNSPLNQAVYPGTDLMNSLFDLLLHFRSNKFVSLADIAKTFLSIKPKTIFNRNRFSFAVYDAGKFNFYRYTIIIFGFIASPFALNFILKHHNEKAKNIAAINCCKKINFV